MTCYAPLQCWRSRYVNKSGKRGVTFKLSDGLVDMPLSIKCGQCIGCRIERVQSWTVRLFYESKCHDDMSFLTLTYDDDHLPRNGTLVVKHLQDFIKRFRQRLFRIDKERKVRYFACGEYGDKFDRPHYHVLLYGFSFPDKKFWSGKGGNKLYRSEFLETLWLFGNSSVGSVTSSSVAYVAGYSVKKYIGKADGLDAHYGDRNPEFVLMSLKPPIGYNYWVRYGGTDILPRGYCVIDGRKKRVPKYYDRLFEAENETGMATVKRRRKKIALEKAVTPERLYELEEFQRAKRERLLRNGY